ncbi:MAG: phosphoribosylanthranilate isomerase [Acidobacteria bacterium]|nr:phosphoribosylanthranilate isomerase [Acidobacteriota bacterium]
MSSVRLKICGLTRETDVDAVAALDVDAVGFVLWPGSPRAVTPAAAAVLGRRLPPWMARVGVMVGPTPAEASVAVRQGGLSVLQVHEVDDVTPLVALGVPIVWVTSLDRAAETPTPAGATLMVDAVDPVRHGGTGRPIDWARAADLARRERLVLAGGLTAENVARAIAMVRPYGVDVSSGVESAPGLKSPERLRQFVAAVRQPSVELPP